MDPARPSNPQKLLTVQQAAQKLGVSSAVLLRWNDQNILKPTITPQGEIAYSEEQINNFLLIHSSISSNDNSAEIGQSQLGRAASTPEESFSPPVKSSRKGLYHRLVDWIGDGFYTDEYIKDYFRTQVKESTSFRFIYPSKRTVFIFSGILT